MTLDADGRVRTVAISTDFVHRENRDGQCHSLLRLLQLLPQAASAENVTGRPRSRCQNRQNGLCGPLRAPPSPVYCTAGNVTLKVHARLAAFVRRDPPARVSRVWARTARKRRDPAGRAGQDALFRGACCYPHPQEDASQLGSFCARHPHPGSKGCYETEEDKSTPHADHCSYLLGIITSLPACLDPTSHSSYEPSSLPLPSVPRPASQAPRRRHEHTDGDSDPGPFRGVANTGSANPTRSNLTADMPTRNQHDCDELYARTPPGLHDLQER
ncbi:hypothetical protein GY45DRAFT_881035 [Cubamyces sp. BRFM 1775]|nr:hypothetical protein GY45DRAFT_881035 [Cubamyces sp. BRFM 1775]